MSDETATKYPPPDWTPYQDETVADLCREVLREHGVPEPLMHKLLGEIERLTLLFAYLQIAQVLRAQAERQPTILGAALRATADHIEAAGRRSYDPEPKRSESP